MKKKGYIFLILLQLNFLADAQLTDGDFEGFTFGGGACLENPGPDYTTLASPFVACSFAGWYASHGTPEIFRDHTLHFATMWSGRWDNGVTVTGEGIFATCHFSKNKTYHITFQLSCLSNLTYTPIEEDHVNDVYIKLANSMIPLTAISWDATSYVYYFPSPASQQTIFHNSSPINTGTWYNFDFFFTANDDYENFWIYPYHSDGPSRIGVLAVDDIFIDCIPFENYTATSSLPGLTLRGDYITASNNTNVLSGQNVTFNAGNYVLLTPDFCANSNSDFLAYIDGCEPLSCYNSGNRMAMSANETKNPERGTPINFYPNPNSGIFTVSSSSDEEKSIFIYDIMGNLVFERSKINEQDCKIDIRDMAKGVYYVKVISASQTKTGKITYQ